jgi:hypothetical protein
MICTEILSHPWHKDGMIHWLDDWSPSVGRMLEGMDATWLGREIGGEIRLTTMDDLAESRRAYNCTDDWGVDLFFYARKE